VLAIAARAADVDGSCGRGNRLHPGAHGADQAGDFSGGLALGENPDQNIFFAKSTSP
jgi:hypothetical protein